MEKALFNCPNQIFNYPNIEAFLEKHIEQRRKLDPRWTINSWAKNLDLPNAASITRVLTGERTITERMSIALTKYFSFSDLEHEYFLFLVLKNKSKTDPILNGALQRGCWPVPTNPDGWHNEKPLLEMMSGKVLTLVGEANLVTVNQLLARGELQCVPANNHALVHLTSCQYGESSVGPYSEFYLAVVCFPSEGSLADFGASFQNIVCDSNVIMNLGTMVWGNDYRVGSIEVGEEGSRVRVNDQIVFEAKLGGNSRPSRALPEAVEMWGFAAVHGSRRRFRLSIESQGSEYTFCEGNDAFYAQGELEKHLQRIEFKPVQWHVRTGLKCKVSPTIPEAGAAIKI